MLDKYRPPFAYGADESKRFKPYMGTERWFPVGTGLGEPGKKTEGEGAKEEMARMQKGEWMSKFGVSYERRNALTGSRWLILGL